MFVRVVRFTDVTAERVQSLVAGIDESGPPPGVPIKKPQLVFDEAQGTVVVLQHFDTGRGECRGGACNANREGARVVRRSTRGDGRGWCGIARLRRA